MNAVFLILITLFFIPLLIFSIVAVVNGTKAIGAYKKMVSEGRQRPTLTLIFGIIGLCLGAIALIAFVTVLLVFVAVFVFGFGLNIF